MTTAKKTTASRRKPRKTAAAEQQPVTVATNQTILSRLDEMQVILLEAFKGAVSDKESNTSQRFLDLFYSVADKAYEVSARTQSYSTAENDKI